MGYGVVFGGGGAKGAYEIGVWKALRELNIPIDVVVGTSVGALNGAIMVQGEYDTAVALWNNLKMSDVIRFEQSMESKKSARPTLSNMARLIKNSIVNGGMDVTPLRELVNEAIDERKIRASHMDFGIVTFSLSDFKPVRLFLQDIPEGMLVEYLLASACFPTFRPQIIDDKRFIDGGVYDNIPISMVMDKCDSIIAIDVSGPGRIRKTDTTGHELVNIKNSEYLGGTLNFDGTTSASNIECGYLDTLKAFDKVTGRRYYILKNTGYQAYLEDEEIEGLYSFFEEGSQLSQQFKRFNSYNYELLKARILGLIRDYSTPELDRNSLFMGMLEICAETVGVERKKIYSVEQLVDEILESRHSYQLQPQKASKASISYYIKSRNISKDIVFEEFPDPINIREQAKKRMAIGLAQPKLMISNIFLSFLSKRHEKQKSATKLAEDVEKF